MRFGLIGTGWWARTVHGRALAGSPEVELVGVWGRHAGNTDVAASELGTRPYRAVEELIGDVDGLAFAVPPDVQAGIALAAARAGKHLLLEKPVATSVAAAGELADAVTASGVATVVFFTSRFRQPARDWLAECSEREWSGGSGRWLAAAFAPDSPFDTPWRHEKGGLWDIGPHALAMLIPTLGPVATVRTAAAGAGDLVHVVFEHESGATSAASLSVGVAPAAAHSALVLWGPQGCSTMPIMTGGAAEASAVALHELLEVATGARASHPCDVLFGATVVGVLAAAEHLLGRTPPR